MENMTVEEMECPRDKMMGKTTVDESEFHEAEWLDKLQAVWSAIH